MSTRAEEPAATDHRRPGWVSGVAIAGAALVAVFLLLGLGDVETARGSCGTGFAPGWSEDAATAAACTSALGDRRLAMLLTGAPGLLLLGAAAVGWLRHARSARH